MMRLKLPITDGLLLAAKATKVIPLERDKFSAADVIDPAATIISTPERTAFATNSQLILLDNAIILG